MEALRDPEPAVATPRPLDDREADADGAAAEGVTLGLLVDPTVKSMLGNCTEARHGTVPSW